MTVLNELYAHDPFEADEQTGFDEGFFALERELLELPCVRECAVVRTELPDLGETVVVAFVPVSADQEAAGRRAILAACERCLPWLFGHVVAVDRIPRAADGSVRAGKLIDQALPQIARDLMSPVAMSD
ncbi:hypothetical protein C3489_01665 [Streptomyces sp. Ru71]|uniref:hypothetical protein n=1 Tax=Streptomyces sp. Ru71 TaxID=2080746 RepID=UPI000CDE0D8D|nr:hypothetical protein [Streptomyces sp. Ru71]POX56987.1 hypothetical protein C3489_01665 [Streptomyces sp. Ru71]